MRSRFSVSTIYPGAIDSKMTQSMLATDPKATMSPQLLRDAKKTALQIRRGLAGDAAHIGTPFIEYGQNRNGARLAATLSHASLTPPTPRTRRQQLPRTYSAPFQVCSTRLRLRSKDGPTRWVPFSLEQSRTKSKLFFPLKVCSFSLTHAQF